jgi:hypothetical protein
VYRHTSRHVCTGLYAPRPSGAQTPEIRDTGITITYLSRSKNFENVSQHLELFFKFTEFFKYVNKNSRTEKCAA